MNNVHPALLPTLNAIKSLYERPAPPAASLGIRYEEICRQNIRKCEADIRKFALEIIEEALTFAKNPEIQEFSNVDPIVKLALELKEAVADLKSNTDELDAI